MKVIEFNNTKEPTNSTVQDHLVDLIESFQKQDIADDECLAITLIIERAEAPVLLSSSNWDALDVATVGAWDMSKDKIKKVVSYNAEGDDEDD